MQFNIPFINQKVQLFILKMRAPDTQSALQLTNTIVSLREAQQTLADAKDVTASHARDVAVLDALIIRATREKDSCENGIRALLGVLADLNGRNKVLSEASILADSELRNTELHQSSVRLQSDQIVGEIGDLEVDIMNLEARKQELTIQVQNARSDVREKSEVAQERRRACGAARLELGRARGFDDRSKLDGAHLTSILEPTH